MPVLRANVEATKRFIRARDEANAPYVYGGALSPTSVRQGTDCSEVWQTVLEMVHGRYVPGRQAEGATTESYRPTTMGGPIPIGGKGPLGTIVVARLQDIPAGAAARLAFHHGPGGGANSHVWGELDGLRIESAGSKGVVTGAEARPVEDRYANSWAYLPGPIVDDGTPISPAPPEVVMLGRRYESGGDRVRQLQVALNAAIDAGLDPDGEFGALTEAAVIAFQRSRNLEADGVAGPVTLAALGLNFGNSSGIPNSSPASAIALLRRVMTPTEVSNAVLTGYLPHLAEATRAAQITTLKRAAAWYSQLGHESSGLRYMAEIQTNGPGWSDDRRIYRGRGPIQLTWSENYRKFGQWCAAKGYVTDPELFVKQPQLVEQPRWGFLAASWYWLNAGPRPGRINDYADQGDILAVSRCVNGWIEGQNPIGWADRRTRYLNCIALGEQIVSLATPSTTVDAFEELLTMKIQSRSPYATPGEPPVEGSDMLATADLVAHRDLTEDDARDGDPDAIYRLARTAAGRGPNPTPARIRRATRIITEIEAANPEFVRNALAKKGL